MKIYWKVVMWPLLMKKCEFITFKAFQKLKNIFWNISRLCNITKKHEKTTFHFLFELLDFLDFWIFFKFFQIFQNYIFLIFFLKFWIVKFWKLNLKLVRLYFLYIWMEFNGYDNIFQLHNEYKYPLFAFLQSELLGLNG